MSVPANARLCNALFYKNHRSDNKSQKQSYSAAAHLEVLLAFARVNCRWHAVRAGRHRQRWVDVHVLHQYCWADSGPVVQPRTAVAMTARSAHSDVSATAY